MRSWLFRFLALVVLASFTSSASVDASEKPPLAGAPENDAARPAPAASPTQVYIQSFPLQAAQEVSPPVGIPGSGTATVTLDTDANTISVSGSYNGMSSNVASAHLHGPAPAGQNAAVRISLTHTGGTSGTLSGGGVITAQQEAEILAGLWYVNVHTVTNPGGEIRGQVVFAPMELDISFEQLTFAFEGYDDVPYSSVGRANFTFATPPTMGFLNLAAHVPGLSLQGSWIVRNLLIPSSSMGPPTENIASRFPMDEMGVLDGLQITQIAFGYTITESPLNDADVPAWYSQLVFQDPVPVAQSRIETHGYERGETGSFDLSIAPFIWFPPFVLPDSIEINSYIGCEMPNVDLDSTTTPGDWNGCAPASCANSLTWLKDKHAEIDFPPDLRATFEQLSNLMNRLAKQGAGPEQILAAKLDFIEAYGLPIHVKYQSDAVEGNRASTTGESSATDGDGAASALPDTAWINAEARKGEDVELGVGFYYIHNDTLYRDGGHAVVVTGTAKINGVPRITYKHDTQQADSTGTKQESSDVVVTPSGIIILPGLGGKIRHTPSSPAVDVIPVVEAAFSESYDANVGAVPAQHTMNAYCDWVKRTIAPGQKISITYPSNSNRCFNATVWRLDRTVQPPKWIKVTVWNFNSGQTREWVNPYPYPVTIAIHNDDHSTAGPYTIDLVPSSVAPGEVTSPSNESAYGGFSLGGADGSSDEFGDISAPIVVVDASLGLELSDVPARLTSAPGGTQGVVLQHPIPAWNIYWENLGVEIRMASVTSPGRLIVDCPNTGDHFEIDVIDVELIELTLTSMPPTTAFEIVIGASAGLDFTFDSIGVPSLTPIATDVEDNRVPRVLALEANHPNPFNPATTIRFALPEASGVALDIFDVSGKLVAPLVRGRYEAGRHETVWYGVDAAGRPVASGIYFYQLRVGDEVLTQKMTLLR